MHIDLWCEKSVLYDWFRSKINIPEGISISGYMIRDLLFESLSRKTKEGSVKISLYDFLMFKGEDIRSTYYDYRIFSMYISFDKDDHQHIIQFLTEIGVVDSHQKIEAVYRNRQFQKIKRKKLEMWLNPTLVVVMLMSAVIVIFLLLYTVFNGFARSLNELSKLF